MEKVICDICGTSYQKTEECCPICGYARELNGSMEFELEDEDFLRDSPMASVRTGNLDADSEPIEEDGDDWDYDEDEDDEEPRRGKTGAVIVLVILIMLLLAAAGFLFLRFVLPNMAAEQTEPMETAVQTDAPVETTTEPGIPCEQLILTSGGVVDLTREGEYRLINVIVKPEDSTDKLVYTSSDETIVSVNEEGRITGLAEGQATITISCGYQKVECRVYVHFVEETEPATEETTLPAVEGTEGDTGTEPEETVAETAPEEETQPAEETVPETEPKQLKDVTLKLGKTDISMGVGYQFTIPLECDLEYDEIEWSTGNAGVATIKDGVITTHSRGTTQLIVKYGEQTITGWIRVK